MLENMRDHKKMLHKEIYRLRLSLDRARLKPGVLSEELDNISKSIQLKQDLLSMLMPGPTTVFAVFIKFRANEYEPHPEWVQFTAWSYNLKGVIDMQKRAKDNPRFENVKIVAQVRTNWDYNAFDDELSDKNEVQ